MLLTLLVLVHVMETSSTPPSNTARFPCLGDVAASNAVADVAAAAAICDTFVVLAAGAGAGTGAAAAAKTFVGECRVNYWCCSGLDEPVRGAVQGPADNNDRHHGQDQERDRCGACQRLTSASGVLKHHI